jgi:hypothetical protein
VVGRRTCHDRTPRPENSIWAGCEDVETRDGNGTAGALKEYIFDDKDLDK